MTSCLAVFEKMVVVSSIDVDKCVVCPLDGGSIKNLIECLGEAYSGMPVNKVDLQKACAAFSSDGKLFAFNTNKGKLLSIWSTVDWSLVENKTLAKNATKIVFSPVTNVITVGDKKGDVYSFKALPVRVLGHSSMILDICFSKDEKYIVTCDSDEKVRVSHYPNGKHILYYMMGHEAYVSGVCMLNNFILSGSGDCTLRLWNLSNGDLLNKLTLSSPVQSVIEIKDLVAVQLYDSNKVHIIKTETNDGNWNIKIIKTIDFENNVLNLAAYSNQLWIITNNSVHSYTIDLSNEIIKNDKEISNTLENVITSFGILENNNLTIFLYKKMIEKQKRTEQCVNDFIPFPPRVKRVKTN